MAQISPLTGAKYLESLPYTAAPATGEQAGSATAVQLANVPCALVRIRARSDNVGSVYLGGSGVTAPDGTTDTTTGFELAPGDETGWLTIANLNQLWIISAVGDDITYMAQG